MGWLRGAWGALVFLAGAPVMAAPDMDKVAQERTRMDLERRAIATQYDAQDQACLERFAVTQCQNQVARERRSALQKLKQQELPLNDAQRQHNAQQEQERLADRARERAEQERERAQRADPDAGADRQSAKAAPLPQARASRPAKTSSAVDADAAAKARAAYADKQKALQERRVQRDQRLQDKAGSKNPLPLSP